jgi:hypothetical protein
MTSRPTAAKVRSPRVASAATSGPSPCIGPTSTSRSLSQSYVCHALPALTVTNVFVPRLCVANGTGSETYPSARNG